MSSGMFKISPRGGFAPSYRRGAAFGILVGASFIFLVSVALLVFVMRGGPDDSISHTLVLGDASDGGRGRLAVGDVLVPTTLILSGQTLVKEMFRVERRPLSDISTEMITSFSQVDGLYARVSIPAEAPLLVSSITGTKPFGVSSDIPDGFRAVTINVNSLSSVEGWVRAGARVDMAWISPVRGMPSITVIAENLLVLSAERQTVEGGTKEATPVPSTITLLATEENAQRIILATTSGSLSLALRGDADKSTGRVGYSVTAANLLGTAPTMKAGTGKVSVRGLGEESEEFELHGNKIVRANGANL